MKKLKFAAFLLALTLSAFSFAGCIEAQYSDGDDKGNDQATVDNIAKDDNIKESDNSSEDSKPAEDQNPDEENVEDSNSEEDKILELGFANVGARYNAVIKPVYDATLTILNDLIECGLSYPDECYKPKVTDIRYFNGRPESLTIYFRKDIYINESDVKAEFLQSEYAVILENFNSGNGGNSSREFNAFYNFLITERKYENTELYEETVLPLAEQVADNFLRLYENYKENKQINLINSGKKLILKANSAYSDVHKKIIDKMNAQLTVQKNQYFNSVGYPLLSDEDIEISVGGNINQNPVYSNITLTVKFQNFCYTFYQAPFNKDGEFSGDWINKFYGTNHTGYTPSHDGAYNPANEEYAEFFNKLKIEEMDFSTFTFHTFEYENTFLHF